MSSLRSPLTGGAVCVRAYEVWPVDRPEWARRINHVSAGRAKAGYWRELRECWPDVPFTAIRSRVAGAPSGGEDFRRTAEYRQVANCARVGGRVRVGVNQGFIVGSNASANFDVLFIDGPCAGQVLNCHPKHQMEFLD